MTKVFISYARDASYGQNLAAQAQDQLLAAGFEVFRDATGLKPGDLWLNKLESELKSSDVMVLVMSKKALTSKWVQNEVHMAEELKIPVIPILSEKIFSPLWLRHLQVLDFCKTVKWLILIEAVSEHKQQKADTSFTPTLLLQSTFSHEVTKSGDVISTYRGADLTTSEITLTQGYYTCLESVSSGTQSFFYKVKRHSDQAIFALKVARVSSSLKAKTLLGSSLIRENCKSIDQEITFLSRLQEASNHHIVNIIDQGHVEIAGYQCPAFVMPWYKHSLIKVLRSTPVPSIHQRLDWIRQMAVSLAYIHQQNKANGEILVHLNFNLNNLMLSADNNVRLLDFGISKSMVNKVTPCIARINYSLDSVAPEQVLLALPNTDGNKYLAIGPHTDIYALGLVINYLITKQYPEAQTAFSDNLEELSCKHRQLLNKDGQGLLGKIGGMNYADRAAMQQAFIALSIPNATTEEPLKPSLKNSGALSNFGDRQPETIPNATSTSIITRPDPALQKLAEEFTHFVIEMTNPKHRVRPSAQAVIYWVENVQLRLKKQRSTNQPKGPTSSSTTPKEGALSKLFGAKYTS